jgi:UDP-N-acetylmuramate: L-alanyl-gamma-D-glutamyl-meso-diaminopimelate ligase
MPELKKEEVLAGFNKENLAVINVRNELEAWLGEKDFTDSIVLFMSSGNYDGFDVVAFSERITSAAC